MSIRRTSVVTCLKLLCVTVGDQELDAVCKLSFERLFTVTKVRPRELDSSESAEAWDAICVDYDYPDMVGLRLIAQIKNRWPSAPIVMLTLQSTVELAVWALRSRVFDFLVKPLIASEFDWVLARLAAAIRARRSQVQRNPQAVAAPLPPETRYRPQLPHAPRLRAALAHVSKHFRRTIPESEVALMCNLSPSRFCREFKAAFGVTFGEYLSKYRISQAKRLLANPTITVADVAGAVGFTDPSYFTRVFRRQEGVSPSEYRASTVFESNRLRGTAGG